jgi:hypothetical protein
MAGRVIRLPVAKPLEAAVAAIAQLDRGELEQLHEQIGAVLRATAPPPAAPTRAERVRTQRGQGWIETRFVRDPETGRRYGPYLVRRWREDRRKRLQYLGKRIGPDPSSSMNEAEAGSGSGRELGGLSGDAAQPQAHAGLLQVPPEVAETRGQVGCHFLEWWFRSRSVP